MSSSYELWISTDTTARQRTLVDALSFEYVKTVNAPGYFSIRLQPDFPMDLAKADNIIEIWRAYHGGSIVLDFVGLVRRIRQTENEIVIAGPDMLDLLKRRIVNYPASDDQAAYNDQADDLIKQVVRDNLGADADASRDLTDAGFTVQANAGAGASIVKSFPWRNVLAVCQDASEASAQAGTAVYFDVVPTWTTTGLTFEFRTFVTRRGIDRTDTTLVGYEIGNLADPVLEYDYTQEVNWCKAGGQGEEADRMTATSEDTDRSGASVWALCEAFQDARQVKASATLADMADKRVSEGRPRLVFTGNMLECETTMYGRDWEFGDELTCTAFGRQFVGMVRSVRVSMTAAGEENIAARLETDLDA